MHHSNLDVSMDGRGVGERGEGYRVMFRDIRKHRGDRRATREFKKRTCAVFGSCFVGRVPFHAAVGVHLHKVRGTIHSAGDLAETPARDSG